MSRRRLRLATGLVAAGALALSACAVADDGEDPAPAEPETTEDAGADDGGEAAAEIVTGQGVTDEPCPDSPNPDNGCIYLGILSDLTEGPFAALAVPITDAQVDFWDQVNANGGISGFDVDEIGRAHV